MRVIGVDGVRVFILHVFITFFRWRTNLLGVSKTSQVSDTCLWKTSRTLNNFQNTLSFVWRKRASEATMPCSCIHNLVQDKKNKRMVGAGLWYSHQYWEAFISAQLRGWSWEGAICKWRRSLTSKLVKGSLTCNSRNKTSYIGKELHIFLSSLRCSTHHLPSRALPGRSSVVLRLSTSLW